MANNKTNGDGEREPESVRKAQGIGCAIILLLIVPGVGYTMAGFFGLIFGLVAAIVIAIVLYYSFRRERGRGDEPEEPEVQ